MGSRTGLTLQAGEQTRREQNLNWWRDYGFPQPPSQVTPISSQSPPGVLRGPAWPILAPMMVIQKQTHTICQVSSGERKTNHRSCPSTYTSENHEHQRVNHSRIGSWPGLPFTISSKTTLNLKEVLRKEDKFHCSRSSLTVHSQCRVAVSGHLLA